MHAPRLSGGPARGIGAGEPGEVPQGVGVVDRVGSDDAIDVRSLDDAFDRYLDLLGIVNLTGPPSGMING